MKAFVVTVCILVGIFVISQSFVYFSMSKIEEHKYVVIKEYDDFEVRRYESALFSSVVLNDTTYEQTANSGFRVLAGYIFGGNETGEKIAMTSPVVMELGDSTKMSFMVPSNYTENDLPKPKNGRIFFERKQGAIMAAIRFGGWADDARIEKYKNDLVQALEKEGLKYTGRFTYLGYNPPYAIVARRNEVVVELTEYNQ
ncbi:MAG: hypothetical protein RIT43_1190 [Bacteroidota bacterium]|jgi:hypothetical protein